MNLINVCHLFIGALLMLPLTVSFAADYVGETACKTCHSKEYQQWENSHHDLAMQEATATSVLGDFNHTVFKKGKLSTTFFKKSQRFMVNADGPDGQLHDYEIAYTFGVYPLQQYMVKFPQGKIQVLDIAWDSREKREGGQRWFNLRPDETINADHVLHWTGPNLNWNYMCADCHSTNLKKNYDSAKHTYQTRWDAIDVSCEACHGPGSEHLLWAEQGNSPLVSNKQINNKGLTVIYPAAKNRSWAIGDKTKKPHLRLIPGNQHLEVEQCAKCHSRRSQLDDQFVPGADFRDHYLPSLLTESLYYPDGKIKDEVYVYGSFAQSKMYQAGVSCSDCHNAHSLNLKAPGDQVCLQCHLSASYQTTAHHFHQQQSTGASCIACHMPAKTYMGVDQRNDHSFRIPRPDLSATLETPNACTLCHKDKNSQWAAKKLQQWKGKIPKGYQQFGSALQALGLQSNTALHSLYGVLMDDASAIAKASVVNYLGEYPSRQTLMTAMQMLRSDEPDIRRQALFALQVFPLQHTFKAIFAALTDPVKIVRIAAASVLAPVPRSALDQSQKILLDKVTEEYRQSLLFVAERPEAQLSLAQLYQHLNQINDAEAAFNEALFLQPKYIPAYVNYADFLQRQDKEAEAFDVLQNGLRENPNAASLHHSLGLWYVRNNQTQKGIGSLAMAAKLEPNSANYQYVYAIAISERSVKRAIQVLESALQKHTGHVKILMALSGYYQQSGDELTAKTYQSKAESVLKLKL